MNTKNTKKLSWSNEITASYLDLGGYEVRYIKSGQGPNLVLLHTLGTSLDIFQKIIPDLSRNHTVYALDYPGHGYSDIPEGNYDAAFFVDAVEKFLEKLDLRDVSLSGISIGASTSLLLAAKQNPRIDRVIAINPYDYAKGKGIARSSLFARVVANLAKLSFSTKSDSPVHNYSLISSIYLGGVTNPSSFPTDLLKELYSMGGRKGGSRALMTLLHNSPSWEEARSQYRGIKVPVRVVWGDHDWSHQDEREQDAKFLPDAEIVEVKDGGHFLSLDQPRAVTEQIQTFTA